MSCHAIGVRFHSRAFSVFWGFVSGMSTVTGVRADNVLVVFLLHVFPLLAMHIPQILKS